tara:strand:- start:645 stop:917 length:273 start_codon:yes stop_codon:yes gene_type:complete
MKNKQGEKMKIKTKNIQTWDCYNFQVTIDGKKFPRERGEFYFINKDNYKDAKEKAITYAVAESEGKYLSTGGIIYSSIQEYEKQQELLNQ